jgi:hypothetical protein
MMVILGVSLGRHAPIIELLFRSEENSRHLAQKQAVHFSFRRLSSSAWTALCLSHGICVAFASA